MSFGGFLGLGHDHYPVPWARLTYSERLGGYGVNVSDQELKGRAEKRWLRLSEQFLRIDKWSVCRG
jgi:hypothetical protein